MKFKEIEFADKNSKRIYKDYINRVSAATKTLNKENQHEVLLEINSHIYESISGDSDNTEEMEKLLNVLEKLGQPEKFLKPLVAEKKLEEATKTFNPVKLLKALILNIGNGISYVIFFLMYLFVFAFIFLIGAKILDPKNVGFFYRPHDLFILGLYKNHEGKTYYEYEQLGYWFIPIMFLAAAILYFLLYFLIKLKKSFYSKKITI